MKKFTGFLAAASLLLSTAHAQSTCEGYMLMEKGVTLEFKDYDGKEKLTGSQSTTITDITDVAGVVTVKMHSISKDAKDKVTSEGDFSFTCQNGEIKIDMSSLMDPKMQEGFEDMEVKIDQTNLTFPAKFTEGMTLPDGDMTMTVSSGGIQMMKMVMNIVERKVEKMESLTTPAGTFDTAKVSAVMKNTMMGRTSSYKSISWIAMGIGPVRTETYNEQGELQNVHVLTNIIR